MATIQLVLLLLAAVLVSSVLDQVIPKVSAPLIQIALGVVIAVLAQGNISIDLDSDLFLVIFIAPLLFHEAVEADKAALWKNKGALLSYAIGLVVVIMIVVGCVTHLVVPSLSLAACLALGAALGPTDAVAVASVSGKAEIMPRQRAILQGESLLNDASGIVSFQFALAAAVTGSWAVAEAVGDFAIEFFGGIIVGVIIGALLYLIIRTVRAWGLDNTTFHVLLEVLTPFIVYLFADSIHVSGVLCVVACGIIMSLTPQNLGPTDSRLNIVSSSVWQVLAYGLNGIVFVLLGTQLPNAIGNTWGDAGMSGPMLIGLVLLITVLMHGARFVWSLVTEQIADGRALRKHRRSFGQMARAALVTTLSGAKGTITLAIMFTIPTIVDFDSMGIYVEFPNRDLLIFLASGVILVSLLLATYVVPLLAPRTQDDAEEATRLAEAKIDIMRRVIEYLTAHETPENRAATAEVIRQYSDRIGRIQGEGDIEEESDVELRIKLLQWQQEYLWELIDAGEVPTDAGYTMLTRLARYEGLLKNDKETRAAISRRGRHALARLRNAGKRLIHPLVGPEADAQAQVMRDIQIRITKYGIDRLQDRMAESDIATEAFSNLVLEQQRVLRTALEKSPSITAFTQREENSEVVRARALRVELEEIQNAYNAGTISRAVSQELRRNVQLMQIDMEDYV